MSGPGRFPRAVFVCGPRGTAVRRRWWSRPAFARQGSCSGSRRAGRRDRCTGRRRPRGRCPAIGRRSAGRLWPGVCVHDGLPVGCADPVEDVHDPVRPAPPDGDAVPDDRQGGEQALADLAGREPRHDAGRDRTVDLRRASRGALRNPGRAEVTGRRHVELNVAGLAEQAASAGAVAPVAHGAGVEGVAPAVHRLGHPALVDPRRRLATEGRQPSPRSAPSACISFTPPPNACGRLPVVAACRGIGVLLSVAAASPQGGHHSHLTRESLRHLIRVGT